VSNSGRNEITHALFPFAQNIPTLIKTFIPKPKNMRPEKTTAANQLSPIQLMMKSGGPGGRESHALFAGKLSHKMEQKCF